MTAETFAGSRKQSGKHRISTVLPLPPDDLEKISYVDRHLLYLTLIILIGAISAIGSQAAMEVRYSIWPLVPYTAFSVFYVALSITANFTGHDFDYTSHQARVEAWRPISYPDVDIHLPICGEPISILRNTWIHVFELVHTYPGCARAYVLDDSADVQARELAISFGFGYIVRENRPWMKKGRQPAECVCSYAWRVHSHLGRRLRSASDLCPKLSHTSRILTSQSSRRLSSSALTASRRGLSAPLAQYKKSSTGPCRYPETLTVRRSASAHVRSTGARHSTPTAELRPSSTPRMFIPDSICVRVAGTCIISQYRWLPGSAQTILASFLTQQYRWCAGSMSLLISRKFWATRMPWRARICYMSGFCYYMYTAIAMLVSPLIPSLLLILIPAHIESYDYLSLLPAMINGMVLYPLWHRCLYGPSTWPLAIIRGWAHALALWDTATRNHMGWQVTGGTGRKSRTNRFWVGMTTWNGGAAIAWLSLAAWRITNYGPGRFWIIATFGVLYTIIILWILVTAKDAA